MNLRTSTFRIEVVWVDLDLQEAVVSASSECFGGRVNLYAGTTELTQLANCISGFPRNRADRREFQLGQDGLTGYGTARIVLYCRDSTGHIVLEATLQANPEGSQSEAECSVVHVPAVPADIDRFEHALRRINSQSGGRAVLENAA